VSVGYLGDTAGTYDTGGTLRASLVDQFGANVSGRSITFAVNGAAAGSSVTGSGGIATTAFTPLLDGGTYATSATFAGDSMYIANAGTGSIAIAKKASSVSYTGALTGGPNKSITLSAILKDATGKLLQGRMIVFQIGRRRESLCRERGIGHVRPAVQVATREARMDRMRRGRLGTGSSASPCPARHMTTEIRCLASSPWAVVL
jgi:hypothetical protein